MASKGPMGNNMFSQRTSWDSEKNRITLLCDRIKRQGSPFFDLTQSNPTRCGFEFPAKELSRSLVNEENFIYQPDSKGLVKARKQVARYYKSKEIDVLSEHIILTSSTSEGYSFLFRLLADVGEEILFPQPGYPLFPFLTELNDARMVRYPLRLDKNWPVDLNQLEASITENTKAIVLVNPNNPTGSYISDEEIAKINEICLKHNLCLICDEVFLDYDLENNTNKRSVLGKSRVLTFVLSGLSKILAMPQMKLSWIVVAGEDDLVEKAVKRLEIISDTYLSVNTPVQHALGQWFLQKEVIQGLIRLRVKENLLTLEKQCSNHRRIELIKPQGGWYAIVKVKGYVCEEEFVFSLLKDFHVYVHPGYFYDFTQDGFFVLSLLPLKNIFEEGVNMMLSKLNA